VFCACWDIVNGLLFPPPIRIDDIARPSLALHRADPLHRRTRRRATHLGRHVGAISRSARRRLIGTLVKFIRRPAARHKRGLAKLVAKYCRHRDIPSRSRRCSNAARSFADWTRRAPSPPELCRQSDMAAIAASNKVVENNDEADAFVLARLLLIPMAESSLLYGGLHDPSDRQRPECCPQRHQGRVRAVEGLRLKVETGGCAAKISDGSGQTADEHDDVVERDGVKVFVESGSRELLVGSPSISLSPSKAPVHFRQSQRDPLLLLRQEFG